MGDSDACVSVVSNRTVYCEVAEGCRSTTLSAVIERHGNHSFPSFYGLSQSTKL
ncbi:MAG: hypothetical protein HYZ53_26615 [Planctomycetes bacterium]|nr:hypothetical protein [Planctomycetota bacterium]